MNVVHLSTTDSGGAAGAARRIHEAMVERGVASTMAVAIQRVAGSPVHRRDDRPARAWRQLWPRLNALQMRLLGRPGGSLFTSTLFSDDLSPGDPAVQAADVVCLYWVAGMLSPPALDRLPRPVFWWLPDEWAFTGGCHFSGSCERFREGCHDCPQLAANPVFDLARWEQRRRARHGADIVGIVPSRWMQARARSSLVFRGREVVHLPQGVDMGVFRPDRRDAARLRHGFRADEKVVTFGASNATTDRRKGFDQLAAALAVLREQDRLARTRLVVFGAASLPELPLPAEAIAQVRGDDALADLYAASDAVVLPSREDNLPQIAVESIACGTPIVAFDVGGLPEAAVTGTSGVLAPAGDIGALADGIGTVLGAGQGLRDSARAFAAATFSLDGHVDAMLALFEERLARGREAQRRA